MKTTKRTSLSEAANADACGHESGHAAPLAQADAASAGRREHPSSLERRGSETAAPALLPGASSRARARSAA